LLGEFEYNICEFDENKEERERKFAKKIKISYRVKCAELLKKKTC
jgi:hypothetical protein